VSSSETATSVEDEILPLRELAAYLKVNPRMYRLLTKRRVWAFRVGHAWRFQQRDIDEWMANSGTPEERSESADG
jgi:excisionase family DNA binding protein